MTDNLDSLDSLLADVENSDDYLPPEEESRFHEEVEAGNDSSNRDNSSGDRYLFPEEEISSLQEEKKTSPRNAAGQAPSAFSGLLRQNELHGEVSAQDAEIREKENLFSSVSPGTRDWNTGPPYIISLNGDLLREEMNKLSRVFYFSEEPEAENRDSEEIKKALIDYMRKADPELADTFRNYLFREAGLMLREMPSFFAVSRTGEREFLYHCGSLTAAKCFVAKLRREGKGFCYYYTGNRRGARFFPEETIRSVVMEWFRENIFSSDIDFDNLSQFDRVKRIIFDEYKNDRKRFNSLLERVNLKAGPGKILSPEKLLAMKGADIFGDTKLEIYRRFLGSRIFR